MRAPKFNFNCQVHHFIQPVILDGLTTHHLVRFMVYNHKVKVSNAYTVTYYGQNLSFVHPDHLCFDRTTCDNINGPGDYLCPNHLCST